MVSFQNGEHIGCDFLSYIPQSVFFCYGSKTYQVRGMLIFENEDAAVCAKLRILYDV